MTAISKRLLNASYSIPFTHSGMKSKLGLLNDMSGGTGRRKGLKIPRYIVPCRFNSGPRHQKNRGVHKDVALSPWVLQAVFVPQIVHALALKSVICFSSATDRKVLDMVRIFFRLAYAVYMISRIYTFPSIIPSVRFSPLVY